MGRLSIFIPQITLKYQILFRIDLTRLFYAFSIKFGSRNSIEMGVQNNPTYFVKGQFGTKFCIRFFYTLWSTMKFIKMCISKTKLPNIPISNMFAFRWFIWKHRTIFWKSVHCNPPLPNTVWRHTLYGDIHCMVTDTIWLLATVNTLFSP